MTGLLYLHSFEYEKAEKSFRRAQDLAPGFAMAYWGEAMTYTHPVWDEQDLASGRSALRKLGPTPEARRDRAPTLREQRYLDAVEQYYGGGSKPHRDTLYAAAMERTVREFPTDLEAKAFYALALLGLNQGVRDTSTYLRAGQYADTVFRASPGHPGAAHYLIHAYDDPDHAARGLEAARAYATIAPDAAHAQHMTTHIFLALGMWDEVVSQNMIAMHLTEPLPGHYTSWLVYALVQQGRWDAAHDLMRTLRAGLASGGLRGQFDALVAMRAYYLLHAEAWHGPVAGWLISPDRTSTMGHLTDEFTGGVMAYRRRDGPALARAAAEVARLAEALRVDRGGAAQETRAAEVMARELGAMQLFRSDRREDAVRALREAAAAEAAMPVDFGPPAIVEPPLEVLGEILLETNPAESKAEYETELRRAPNRVRALEGLARASVAVGDKAAAEQAVSRLLVIWNHADPAVRDAIAPLRRTILQMP